LPSGRYRLYAAERHDFPLMFAVRADNGAAERRLYLSAHEQRSWELAELFPYAHPTALRITGTNGSGVALAIAAPAIYKMKK